MNLAETSKLLTLIARYDKRKVDDGDVVAWQPILADLNQADCEFAVVRHFGTSDAYLMPVHVRRGALERARERHRRDREAQEQRALADYAATAGPLTDRSEEIRALVDQVREVLPEGDREALMPRTVAWEREHRAYQRAIAAEPNPAYDPTMRPVEWSASKTPPPGAWWEDEQVRERHAQALLADAGRLRRPDTAKESA